MNNPVIMFYVLDIIKSYDYTSALGISRKEIIELLSHDYKISLSLKQVSTCVEKLNEVLEYLNNGVKIKTIHNVGYALENDFFSDAEYKFLQDSIYSSKQLSSKEMKHLENKLNNVSSSTQQQRLKVANPLITAQEDGTLVKLNTITRAIYNGHAIKFHYVDYEINADRSQLSVKETYRHNGNSKDKNNDATFYVVSPYEIFMVDGRYYIIGYFDKRRNNLSTYRLDRMRQVTGIGKKGYYDYREQFDFQEIKANMVNMFMASSQQDLQLKVHKDILRVVIDQFGVDIEVINETKQFIEIRKKDVMISEGLIGWILMLSNQIEVIYPLSLKENIIGRLKDILEIYNRE